MPVSDYDPIFEEAGREWNVDPALLRSIAHQESGGNRNAKSSAGARGVMQIMPPTGGDLGVTDFNDPAQSIFAGAKYMRQMLDQFKEPALAVAAYNAGPQRIADWQAGKGALPKETAAYVPAVSAHYAKFTKSAAPAPAGKDDSGVPSDEDFLKQVAPKSEPKAAPVRMTMTS
jgi:soluble lytic murein transglycosylase-like protein